MDRMRIQVKSADGEGGTFTGILSTYGNQDLVGDVCEKGCFDRTVAKRSRYPLLWNHIDSEPIGSFDVTGTDDALTVQGRFNSGVARAQEIRALMRAGDVTGMSIGYSPVDFFYDKDGVRHLTDVELYEGSITPFPANPLAQAEAKTMTESKRWIAAMKAAGMSDRDIDRVVKSAKEGEEPKDGEEPKEDTPREEDGKFAPKEDDPKDEEGKSDGADEEPTKEEQDELEKRLAKIEADLEKLKEKSK